MAKNPRRGLHAVSNAPVVAIVGAESLLGRELREVIEAKAIAVNLSLISGQAGGGILTEDAGEAAVESSLPIGELKSAKVVILAGSVHLGGQALELLRTRKAGAFIVDVTGELEEQPDARLRAPLAEPHPRETSALQVIAHPAAIALSIFLRRVQAASPIRCAVLQIFEPASEQGQRGIDELQQQTVSLLSFQKLKKDVFDAQIGFNLLSQYGSDAPSSLANIEAKIDRHLATLLSIDGTTPMPSMRLIQAPVFHGYSFSIWIEFEKNPGVDALSAGLEGPRIEVRRADEEPPTNVGVAGQSEITVGGIVADRNNPRACWFWMVADNLRIGADNAVEVLNELL